MGVLLSNMSFLDGSAMLLLIAILSIMAHSYVKKTLSLPPGPRGLPFIGNLLSMPTEKEWLTFSRWGNEFGERQVT